MKRFLLILFAGLSLLLCTQKASAQAYAETDETETLDDNGHLAIKILCYAYGDWSDPDDNNPYQEGQDYAGVSIGSSSLHGCQLNDPNGQYNWQDLGPFFGGNSVTFTLPVTSSGTWDYWASYSLLMWPCNSDYGDCFDGYPYDDPWGYTAYAGDPVDCPLNGGECEGNYDGEDYVASYEGLEYAYSGDSSTGAFGTFYVDALAIDISPGYYALEAGQQVTFTAGASNTADFLPFYQWTLSSGTQGKPAPGSGAPSGSSDQDYIYTAPPQIDPTNTTAVLQGCVQNLTATPVFENITIDLLAETVTLNPPSPGVLLANSQSVSYLSGYVTNGPSDASIAFTAVYGTVGAPSGTSATYQAPGPTLSAFQTLSSNVVPDTITGTIQGSSPPIANEATIQLVQPVSITNVPASLTAYTTVAVNIVGAGFGTAGSTPSVTFTNPSWGAITINSPCTATSNTAISCPSVTIPPNLANVGASPTINVTVSVTTDGLNSSATSSAINVVPIAYTYNISLLPSTSSVTYGSSSTITPVVTCKTSNGAACASNVSNPQLANFSITNGVGLGSLSNTTNAASTVFTDTALIGYPAQNATVQGCASVAPTVCATTNFSIPATAITLNPATLNGPMTAGQTQPFSASIQNEGTATGLTWTLTASPSGAAPGTMSSATTTITQQGSPASGTSGPNTYFAPNPIATAASVTLNVCMTAKTSICATPITIQLPGLSIAATNNNPSQTALSLGHSMSYTIAATALDGFSGTVGLSASGLPAGVTAQFSPATLTAPGSSTLTLTAAYSNSTYVGNSTVTVTGTGGGTAQPAAFTLTTRPLQYKGYCGVQ
ncbi:MAG: hypothetical protein WCF30_10295 [Terracidiphilus sp.]